MTIISNRLQNRDEPYKHYNYKGKENASMCLSTKEAINLIVRHREAKLLYLLEIWIFYISRILKENVSSYLLKTMQYKADKLTFD